MRDLEAGKWGDVLSFSVQVLKTFIFDKYKHFPPSLLLYNFGELMWIVALFFFS